MPNRNNITTDPSGDINRCTILIDLRPLHVTTTHVHMYVRHLCMYVRVCYVFVTILEPANRMSILQPFYVICHILFLYLFTSVTSVT